MDMITFTNFKKMNRKTFIGCYLLNQFFQTLSSRQLNNRGFSLIILKSNGLWLPHTIFIDEIFVRCLLVSQHDSPGSIRNILKIIPFAVYLEPASLHSAIFVHIKPEIYHENPTRSPIFFLCFFLIDWKNVRKEGWTW